MTKISLISKAALALTVACGVASATITYNFTNNPTADAGSTTAGASNQYSTFSTTSGGVQITATAWSTSSTGTALAKNADIGIYSGAGLGECSPGDVGSGNPLSNCFGGAPQHQIDNSGSFEFVLFTFNNAVDLSTISLANFGTTDTHVDMDLSYWTSGNVVTDAAATLSTLSTKGFSTKVDILDTSNSATSITDTFTTNNTNVKSLLVGAYVALGSDPANVYSDFFKIQSLGVNLSTTQGGGGGAKTPEPATFVMAGAALVGLGFSRRRAGAQK